MLISNWKKISHRKRLLLAFLILLLSSAFYAAAMAPQGEAVEHTAPRSGTPPYGLRGSHPVGMRNLVTEGETPVEMTVWYPALKRGNDEQVTTYPYVIKVFPPLGATAIAAYEGEAIGRAPYDLAAAPYPLVILSPGYAIGSTTYAWLAEHLASHGFVVLSPEHDEYLLTALGELWRSAVLRPQRVLTVLSYLDGQVGTGGAFEGLIDPELVAVVGHSYGGYTALAAAGARLDTAGFEARCEIAYEEGDPNAWLCDALLPHVTEMAELAGLDAAPEDLWPAWAAPRVDAIVPLAGDAYLFDQAGLAEITVPVMAMGGTQDGDTPYLWGTHPTYEFTSSPKKVRVAFNDAEHMIFTGPCAAIRRFMKVVPNDFCSDPHWDKTRAHDLINHFTTAFLLAELKQDPDAAAALAPGAVAFPGVTVQAQGY